MLRVLTWFPDWDTAALAAGCDWGITGHCRGPEQVKVGEGGCSERPDPSDGDGVTALAQVNVSG